MHFVIIVNVDEVVCDKVVIWQISIVERVNMVEDSLHIFDVPRRAYPQFFARVLKALGLDIAHLVNSEVALLTPL